MTDGEEGQTTSGSALPAGCFRSLLWLSILLLTLVAAVLIGFRISRAPEPNQNRLALGDAGPAGAVEIEIRHPVELDFRTRAEVLQMRAQAVGQQAGLVQGDYQPAETVFAQIEDHLPWWGLAGIFYYGPGERSIEGRSEESRFLLNPYLLVAPDLYHDWRSLPESEIRRPGFRIDCEPSNLRWFPRDRRAEVTYDASCVAGTNSRQFDLISYNARDLNLNYIYVSYDDSRNISKADPPSEAFAIPHYLHRGSSCGYPGGCNNMSPPTPEIDRLRIVGFPAKIVVFLWQDNPRGVTQPPDMIFVIRFS